MPADVLIVDAGHLFASAGRALGTGPQRMTGRFSMPRLIDALLALTPAADIEWVDALRESGPDRDQRAVMADPRVTFVSVPLRANKQQHVETAVMLSVLRALDAHPTGSVFLLGDPRRHSLTLQEASARGRRVRLIGVSGGESVPANRIWLRRPELLAARRRLSRHEPAAAHSSTTGYTPPMISGSSPVTPLRRHPGTPPS